MASAPREKAVDAIAQWGAPLLCECERERDLRHVNSVFSHDDEAFVRFGAKHFAHKRRPRECMREFQVCIQLPFKEPVHVYWNLSFMLFSIVSGVDCACLK